MTGSSIWSPTALIAFPSTLRQGPKSNKLQPLRTPIKISTQEQKKKKKIMHASLSATQFMNQGKNHGRIHEHINLS